MDGEVNTTPVVTGVPTGEVNANAAGSQNTGDQNTAPAAGDTNTQPQQDQQPKMVPVQALEDERRKRQEFEQALLILRQQIPQPQQSQQPQTPQDVFAQMGLSDNDFPDVKTLRAWEQRQRQQFATMQVEADFNAQHNDFSDVVGKVNPVTGQFEASESLQKALSDPATRYVFGVLNGHPAQRYFAYAIASKAAQVTPPDTRQVVTQIKQAATSKPASISSATGTGNIDKANWARTASDAEFNAYCDQIKAKGRTH